jgi:aminomethyltransferase
MFDKSILRTDCGTPFHSRTAALNMTTWWYGWSNYVIPDVFTNVDDEVDAVRNSVAVIDMSPLPKVEFSGPDATRYIDYLSVRSTAKSEVGHALYTAWCNHEGKLITDGIAFRLEENRYIISSDTSLRWFQENREGFDVELTDRTDDYGVLSLQGPKSREVLSRASGVSWDDFRFCRIRHTTIGAVPVFVARQGFTGELGYEIWVTRANGPALWDAIFTAGEVFGIRPVGEYALDIARVEAGLTLASADYTNPGPDGHSAHVVVDADNISSPYEVGLGYLVHLNKGDFIGKVSLQAEMDNGGPARGLVGLELNWQEILDHYVARGLPPEVTPRVRWDTMPVKVGDKISGRASSATWSPTLKKLIAFACLDKDLSQIGTEVRVDWRDQCLQLIGPVTARVVGLPFIDIKRVAG